MMIKKEFVERYNNQDIYTYTLCGDIEVEISTLGATLLSLKTPDRNGNLVDILLNFPEAKDRGSGCGYMGCAIGRNGNRIGSGGFSLEGKTYPLAQNDGGKAHLHGGVLGFHQKNFDAEVQGTSLVMTCFSPDGEEGYPANLTFAVKYTVVGTTLVIEYFAESDGTTIINPTNHAYFNLSGEKDGSILDNILQINADRYLPTDKNLIPTGEERCVEGTPFDFREAKAIGKEIGSADTQLATAGGYDHNFCIADYDGTLKTIATAKGDKSGIVMNVKTDLPGVQLYTGNFLDGSIIGKNGVPMTKRSAFCLETQVYPDSPNHPEWPSCIFDANEEYKTTTVFCFSLL
jgi:aldose 1-epimerase